jgi:hypothetical protein
VCHLSRRHTAQLIDRHIHKPSHSSQKKTLIYTYDMIDGDQGTRPNPSEI